MQLNPKLKARITKLVMFSIKNHWSILVILAVLQFITGKQMAGSVDLLPVSYKLLSKIHDILGILFLIVAITLSLEKFYLYLLSKKKI